MSLFVRRTVDRHPQAVSLIKLLDDIAANSDAVTIKAFAKFSPNPDLPEEFFENGVLKKKVILADIETLLKCTESVTANTDKWFAHWDEHRRKSKFNPTFDDLHNAVDCIIEMYKRYYRLIKESGLILA